MGQVYTHPPKACLPVWRISEKAQSEVRDGEEQVPLGPAQTVYAVAAPGSARWADALHIVEFALESAETAKCRWPTRPQDVASFGNDLQSFCRRVRSHRRGDLGFDGGLEGGSFYKVKSCVRAVLHIALEANVALKTSQFAALASFMPDEGDHLRAVLDSLPAGVSLQEVEQVFGCPATLVSCWACLAGWASETQQSKLLRASDHDILSVVDKFVKEQYENDSEVCAMFPPGPATIAALLRG